MVQRLIDIEVPLRKIEVSDVKMYHVKAVAKFRGLVAAAQEKMGGTNIGLGLIGSPGWVIGGAVVLGAVEAALSSANAKAGVKLLEEASALMAEIHARGRFFPVAEVANIHFPNPQEWTSVHDGVRFMCLSDDFIVMKERGKGEINIRWSSVSSYRVISA